MGDFNSAAVKMGNITGVLVKLPEQNQTDMIFGFTDSGDINVHSTVYGTILKMRKILEIFQISVCPRFLRKLKRLGQASLEE